MENKKFDSLERFWVQFLLRAGLAISVVLMFIGIAIKVSQGDYNAPGVALFDLFSAGLTLGDRFMAIGVFILALTPALRVLLLMMLWIKEKDWKFVGIAVIVMITLVVSLVSGKG